MSGHEYLKYLTAEITTYMDLPAHRKKERKLNHSQPAYINRWFGMLPFMIKILFKRKK